MTGQREKKDDSMRLQRTMLENYYEKLSRAKESGKKVVYTFVPGNLNELLTAFDVLAVHPEVNALQLGMRKKSDEYIIESENDGHSEDVCAYVKCHLGMMNKGGIGPTGTKIPPPDLLLLSYTGCATYLKWFELLRERYHCPIVMLHVPYVSENTIQASQIKYVADQIRDVVVPALEKLTGKKLDKEKLGKHLDTSARTESHLMDVWESAKHQPSPIDAFFGGVYYVGPIFGAFGGLSECEQYYLKLKEEVQERVQKTLGPMTPEGELKDQKWRVVIEGTPPWTHFREFWKMFYDEGAVVVSSSYTRVGGYYDEGFRHDSRKPFESMAEYCLSCYTNRSVSSRIDILERFIKEYKADGFLVNSTKSCNSFSSGQMLILKELERRTGKPGCFIESDLVDPRYFNTANIANRLYSYFQILERREGKRTR